MAAAVFAAAVAGCGGEDPDDRLPATAPPLQTAPPTSAAGVDLTAEEQRAVDEVLKVFGNFIDAYVEVATSTEPLTEELATQATDGYVRGELWNDVRQELIRNFEDDLVFEGDLGWSFVDVEAVDLDRVVRDNNVPEVTVRVCVDATDWTAVDKSSGEPAGEPGDRHLSTLTASWVEPNGDHEGEPLLISDREDQEDQPC